MSEPEVFIGLFNLTVDQQTRAKPLWDAGVSWQCHLKVLLFGRLNIFEWLSGKDYVQVRLSFVELYPSAISQKANKGRYLRWPPFQLGLPNIFKPMLGLFERTKVIF